MASMVLGFVGNALGGPIGGFIGSTIGSWIDGALFPQKQEGPRLEDLSVTTSTLGVPIPRLYGPENRVATNVIWSTPLKETAHKEGGKGGPSVEITTYTYSVSVALLISGRRIQGVKKIWANSKVIFGGEGNLLEAFASVFGKGANGALFEEVRVYKGTDDQMPDPLIQAEEGADNTPAYRGRAYVVIEDLQLADFGNRIPNFEVLCVADEEITVGDIAGDILDQSGIDVSLSSLGVRDQVRGFVLGRPVTGSGALQPLSIAFNFDIAEVWGSLRLQPRDKPPAGTIRSDFLAVRDQSEGAIPDRLAWTRMRETNLPKSSAITYFDSERDYQNNTQRARRRAGSAENEVNSEVAIVLDADHAQRTADRLLWEAWTSRESAIARADQRYISVEPGRTYLFETAAGWEPLRILRKSRGVNGLIELELRRDRAEVFRSTNRGASVPVPVNELRLPGETVVQLIDTPMLTDKQDDTGFYVAMMGLGNGWRGANLLRSPDGGGSFENVLASGKRTVMATAGAFGPSQDATWDNATVIEATVLRPGDAFESVTDEQALAGRNAIWVGPADGQGGEVIYFADALETSPGVFQLTRLLRGRKGTNIPDWMDHPAGQRVVLLAEGLIETVDFGPADIGKVRAYQAVSLLLDPADSNVFEFTNGGARQRPLSPTLPQADILDSGDIAVRWVRRSRLTAPGLGNGAVLLGEEAEAYMVEVERLGAVVRQEFVTADAWTYGAAEQAADGWGPGDAIQLLVYQMTNATPSPAGFGFPLEILVQT